MQKGSDWATGSLQPQADGATATLKGTLSGITIAEDDVLTLQFPRSGALDYTGQVGTQADIAAKYDYATASVTVASISATGNIIPEAATTTFTNQQAIVKFTLKDKGNSDAAISATELTVSDGTTDYTVTPEEATSEIYVAISGISGQTVTLTATVGEDTYTYEKANVTFTNGQYYEITVKMEKEAAITDLSTLTGNYTAKDGETLTGTLAGNYKITIADGATVTLDGVTINGENDQDYDWAGLTLAGDGTIILSGTNTVKGFYEDYPGIHMPSGKTVTIKGDGSLTASSNGYGVGIGGGYSIACGNITIEGGTIVATGGYAGAGIGSGQNGSCGYISITGGTITATGGTDCVGIGSGNLAECGSITIANTVTKVTANKDGDSERNIGAGVKGECGTVTIGGTEYPNGISDSPYTYQPTSAATIVTWDNLEEDGIPDGSGVTMECNDGINFDYGFIDLDDEGYITFSNSLGKKFTKIVFNTNGQLNDNSDKLGDGWRVVNDDQAIWEGNAESVNLFNGADGYITATSIEFTLE